MRKYILAAVLCLILVPAHAEELDEQGLPKVGQAPFQPSVSGYVSRMNKDLVGKTDTPTDWDKKRAKREADWAAHPYEMYLGKGRTVRQYLDEVKAQLEFGQLHYSGVKNQLGGENRKWKLAQANRYMSQCIRLLNACNSKTSDLNSTEWYEYYAVALDNLYTNRENTEEWCAQSMPIFLQCIRYAARSGSKPARRIAAEREVDY